ncbi:MAG: hypothetical protein R3249_04315 [Nitriliruptorales bacterium]|nr:hypothetical protein [Nitriliruptorales bacterium]
MSLRGSAGDVAPRALNMTRALTLAPVILAFPIGTWLVFGLDADRDTVADGIAWVYSLGLFATFTVPFWPLPALRSWSPLRRVQSAVLVFLVVSCVTHLSWELGWLLLHERIADAADQPWAYIWWAYIDGGDARYLLAPTELVAVEILSVCNGLVGVTGLVRWVRSRGTDRTAILLFMATAVVHLYSASWYYLTEILAGLPNVDTTSLVDTWIKFGLANAPWVTMPWLVLWWGRRQLLDRMSMMAARAGPITGD